ncbi:hypothetical protein Pmar_PMAR002782, partial [Perkinsus marinus ATCC 50983]
IELRWTGCVSESIPTAVHRLLQGLAVPPTVTQWHHWDPNTEHGRQVAEEEFAAVL